jgi:hypothetical protein
VTLPNGRAWPKKGDAKTHFREMLNRYAVWDRVTDANDLSDLVAILTIYDKNVPSSESKIGGGIDYFEKRPDQEHEGSSACFFVVRTDGTSIDFSVYKALDAAAKK